MEKIGVVFFPDPAMLDSWISYPNQFKLCIKNYKHYATKAVFCWTKHRDLLLYAINISLHHVEFSGAFLNLIIIYAVTESLHVGKSETWEKTTEAAFHKCSGNRCSVRLNKIHRKVSVPESHLNIVAGLQSATLLRKRPRHRCFPFIT